MTPVETQPVAAPPDDPVGKALEDPDLRDALVNHALAVLGRRLAGRPAADRIDKAKEAFQETCLRGRSRNAEITTRPGRWVPGFTGSWPMFLSETIRLPDRLAGSRVADAADWETAR